MKKRADKRYWRGRVNPRELWNAAEIKTLDWNLRDFNDTCQVNSWVERGFMPRVGKLFDMGNCKQPSATKNLQNWASDLKHVGITYYCMRPGDNLPPHRDSYRRYRDLYDLNGMEHLITRYIFFVEDWKSGHYLEVDGNPIVRWRAGDWVAWRWDVKHSAANFGLENRYTIQLTGVKDTAPEEFAEFLETDATLMHSV